MSHASAREALLGVCEMIRPPARVTVAESAARNLKIVNPSGAGGNWNPETTPYLIEPMNLARSRLYEGIVLAGPARSGKTIGMVDCVCAYSICDDPADILILQTNQTEAEDYAKRRIGRGIDGSPELRKRLSPRAHDNNVLYKMFRSGMILKIGWPSMGQLSGKDIKRCIATDTDNFTGDISIDEAWGLMVKRTQTFGSSGIAIAESSPAKDYLKPKWRPSTPHEAPPAEGILSLYNRGDRRRWYWPCPECKEYFEAAPGLGLFHLPPFEELCEVVKSKHIGELAERWALVFCPNPGCGVGIEPRWKWGMNHAMPQGRQWVGEGQKIWPDGTLTGEYLRAKVASFWLGGVAAEYQSWESLIERWLQAVKQYATTGESKALKTTTNVDQAMPYTPISAAVERDANELEARAEMPSALWLADHVPHGVRYLVASVDVQKHCFVVQVEGIGPHGERWIVDRYALRSSVRPDPAGSPLPIDPAGYIEDWERLTEKVVKRRYPLSGQPDKSMPIIQTMIDSGGKAGVTKRAYDYWRSLRTRNLHRRVRLVKGASTDNAEPYRESFPKKTGPDGRTKIAIDVPLVIINTTIYKDAVVADLIRTTPGPGYTHLPKWVPKGFFDEYTAETRGAKRWENPGNARNEAFDLSVYNRVAEILAGGDKINWNAPPLWAQTWDKNSEINGGTPPTVTPFRRRMISSGVQT